MTSILLNATSLCVLAFVVWRFRAVVKADAQALKQFLVKPWTRTKVRELFAYGLLGAWFFGAVWIVSTAISVHWNQQ